MAYNCNDATCPGGVSGDCPRVQMFSNNYGKLFSGDNNYPLGTNKTIEPDASTRFRHLVASFVASHVTTCETDADVCDDHDPCTMDSCDDGVICVHMPKDYCNDDNVCTDDTCDENGQCQHESMICNSDGNPCATGTCYPQTGCQFEPIPHCCGNGKCEAPEETVETCLIDCTGLGNNNLVTNTIEMGDEAATERTTAAADPAMGVNGDPIILGLRHQVFKLKDEMELGISIFRHESCNGICNFVNSPSCPNDENMFVSGMSLHQFDDSRILIVTTPDPTPECVQD
eukprot:CAMPEP_0178896846 /NCGR_PEP_ID=MMETSP0786-20121207/1410_1 /TAXON_ID=186022 /ORGANISM="Thalassionema frauenfeldii, Strain CCMP 1798" /LENGTH=285 /DNA_ID=CAMNT_0020567315 /DNA_START=2163 /DNA_END=3017 /DNA_ORIENTATION=+